MTQENAPPPDLSEGGSPTVPEKILVMAGLLGLFGLAASQVKAFDIFWQLQSGRYMAQTGRFIHRDLFSLAAGAPRFEHCWLHDLIFYGAFRLGGYHAVSLLKGLLVAATGGLAVAAARRRSSSWPAILLLTLPLLLLTWGAWMARPQLWTFLFFCLFLWILEGYRARPRRLLVWLLLPLLVIWANLHAGAILAVPVLAAYLVGEGGALLVSGPSSAGKSWRRLLWVSLLLPLPLLATPYGMQMVQTLLHAPSLGSSSGVSGQVYNMDWRGTTFAASPIYYYVMGGTLLLLVAGWRRLTLTDGLLLAGLAFMGLRLERHTIIFFLAAAVLLPRYLDAAGEPVRRRFGNGGRQLLRLGGCLLAAAVLYYQVPPILHEGGFFRTGLLRWHYPVAAAEFVQKQQLPANLYNTYDWGGYLMWTLYPKYKVFWDGRSDSRSMFNLGMQVMRGAPGWQAVLDRYGVDTVVTKACTMDTGQHYPVIDALARSPRWALVFADQSALIFVRRKAVPAAWLAAHQLPPERIDDTILSEARLLLSTGWWRYMAFWEIARIDMSRGNYREALQALRYYLRQSPQRDPRAEQYYRMLQRMVGPRP